MLHLTKKKCNDITAKWDEANENFHPTLRMLLEGKLFCIGCGLWFWVFILCGYCVICNNGREMKWFSTGWLKLMNRNCVCENWTMATSRIERKIGLNLSINCWSAPEVLNCVHWTVIGNLNVQVI